jgi:hypothetical protein
MIAFMIHWTRADPITTSGASVHTLFNTIRSAQPTERKYMLHVPFCLVSSYLGHP